MNRFTKQWPKILVLLVIIAWGGYYCMPTSQVDTDQTQQDPPTRGTPVVPAEPAHRDTPHKITDEAFPHQKEEASHKPLLATETPPAGGTTALSPTTNPPTAQPMLHQQGFWDTARKYWISILVITVTAGTGLVLKLLTKDKQCYKALNFNLYLIGSAVALLGVFLFPLKIKEDITLTIVSIGALLVGDSLRSVLLDEVFKDRWVQFGLFFPGFFIFIIVVHVLCLQDIDNNPEETSHEPLLATETPPAGETTALSPTTNPRIELLIVQGFWDTARKHWKTILVITVIVGIGSVLKPLAKNKQQFIALNFNLCVLGVATTLLGIMLTLLEIDQDISPAIWTIGVGFIGDCLMNFPGGTKTPDQAFQDRWAYFYVFSPSFLIFGIVAYVLFLQYFDNPVAYPERLNKPYQRDSRPPQKADKKATSVDQSFWKSTKQHRHYILASIVTVTILGFIASKNMAGTIERLPRTNVMMAWLSIALIDVGLITGYAYPKVGDSMVITGVISIIDIYPMLNSPPTSRGEHTIMLGILLEFLLLLNLHSIAVNEQKKSIK